MREDTRAALKKKILSLRGCSVARRMVITPLRSYFRYFPLRAGKTFVWTHLADHLWWLEFRTKCHTCFGNALDVDARDDCGRFISYFGVWEPNLTALVERCLKPGDCFVDVGANVGYFSLLGSRLVGQSGRVVSIEAVPRTFAVLRKNLNANGAENVRALNMAAWDREETLTFFVSPDTINGTSTAVPSLAQARGLCEQCVVRAAPLWSLLQPDEIAAARLIKIDVEGVERRVIDGLGPILETSRTDLEVVIEVSIDAFEEVVAFFRKRSFFPYHLKNDYKAKSYIYRHETKKPQRLDAAPKGETQLDLVFSRIDAATLP